MSNRTFWGANMNWITEAVKAARSVVALSVRSGDQVLLVGTPDIDPEVHQGFAIAVTELGAEPTIVTVPSGTSFELPRPVRSALQGADMVVLAAARVSSFAHDPEVRSFVERGGRVISMPAAPGPGKSMEFLLRAGQWDREKLLALRDLTLGLVRRIQGRREVRVTSELGTELRVRVDGKQWHTMYGIAERDDESAWGPEPGKLGRTPWNSSYAVGATGFPPSEVHNPTVPDTAEGVVYVDSSTNGVNDIREPIRVVFEKGWVTEVSGGVEAAKLREIIDGADESARRFSEIGIGTNPWQRVTGLMGEDKKVAGGIHFAVGCNMGATLWGDIEGAVHLDCVAVKQQPTVEVDGEVIVKGGKVLTPLKGD